VAALTITTGEHVQDFPPLLPLPLSILKLHALLRFSQEPPEPLKQHALLARLLTYVTLAISLTMISFTAASLEAESNVLSPQLHKAAAVI
jgi:hypothetical protein